MACSRVKVSALASPTPRRRPSSSAIETSAAVNGGRRASRVSTITPSGSCPASSGVAIALRGRIRFTTLITPGSTLDHAGISAATSSDSRVTPVL